MPSNYESFSINLLWKNKELDESQSYIYPCDSEEKLCAQFLNQAKKWKEVNPEIPVIIWYDSATTSKEAFAATQSVIDKKFKEHKAYNLLLRDIRELKIVRANPDVFSENTPIYFIVDILKLIICLNAIECDGFYSAIFSDLEVREMHKEELFKSEIKIKLEQVGIQANGTENQFIQMINRSETIDAVKTYINSNLSRATTALNLVRSKIPGFEHAVSNISTVVFDQMKSQLFCLIVAYKDIKVKAALFEPKLTETEWVSYDFVKHGCLALGNYFVKTLQNAYCIRIENNKVEFLGECESTLMQFPKHARGATQACYRNDVQVRHGQDHDAVVEDLKCFPANGKEYTHVYCQIENRQLDLKVYKQLDEFSDFRPITHEKMYNTYYINKVDTAKPKIPTLPNMHYLDTYHIALRKGEYQAQVDKALNELYKFFLGYGPDSAIIQDGDDFYFASASIRDFMHGFSNFELSSQGIFKYVPSLEDDMHTSFKKMNLKGLASIVALAYFFGESDIHFKNWGMQENQDILRAYKIDSADALDYALLSTPITVESLQMLLEKSCYSSINDEKTKEEYDFMLSSYVNHSTEFQNELISMLQQIVETPFEKIQGILKSIITTNESCNTKWINEKMKLFITEGPETLSRNNKLSLLEAKEILESMQRTCAQAESLIEQASKRDLNSILELLTKRQLDLNVALLQIKPKMNNSLIAYSVKPNQNTKDTFPPKSLMPFKQPLL